MKKEVSVEAGKEVVREHLKNQKDTSVSEALLKVLEILPSDMHAFLKPVLEPPAVSKKGESEKVPTDD